MSDRRRSRSEYANGEVSAIRFLRLLAQLRHRELEALAVTDPVATICAPPPSVALQLPPRALSRVELPAVKREDQQPEHGCRDRSRWNGGQVSAQSRIDGPAVSGGYLLESWGVL